MSGHAEARSDSASKDVEASISRLDEALHTGLPKSYKDFLRAYRPSFSGHDSRPDVGMYEIGQVGLFRELEPDYLRDVQSWSIDSTDNDYFRYGIEQVSSTGRTRYLRDAIVVGKYASDSFALVVLYPQVRTADGEFEASLLEHSGEFRAPSFAELMRQLSVLETMRPGSMPPYSQQILDGTCASRLPMGHVWWK